MNRFCKMSLKHPPVYYLMTIWENLNEGGWKHQTIRNLGEKKDPLAYHK